MKKREHSTVQSLAKFGLIVLTLAPIPARAGGWDDFRSKVAELIAPEKKAAPAPKKAPAKPAVVAQAAPAPTSNNYTTNNTINLTVQERQALEAKERAKAEAEKDALAKAEAPAIDPTLISKDYVGPALSLPQARVAIKGFDVQIDKSDPANPKACPIGMIYAKAANAARAEALKQKPNAQLEMDDIISIVPYRDPATQQAGWKVFDPTGVLFSASAEMDRQGFSCNSDQKASPAKCVTLDVVAKKSGKDYCVSLRDLGTATTLVNVGIVTPVKNSATGAHEMSKENLIRAFKPEVMEVYEMREAERRRIENEVEFSNAVIEKCERTDPRTAKMFCEQFKLSAAAMITVDANRAREIRRMHIACSERSVKNQYNDLLTAIRKASNTEELQQAAEDLIFFAKAHPEFPQAIKELRGLVMRMIASSHTPTQTLGGLMPGMPGLGSDGTDPLARVREEKLMAAQKILERMDESLDLGKYDAVIKNDLKEIKVVQCKNIVETYGFAYSFQSRQGPVTVGADGADTCMKEIQMEALNTANAACSYNRNSDECKNATNLLNSLQPIIKRGQDKTAQLAQAQMNPQGQQPFANQSSMFQYGSQSLNPLTSGFGGPSNLPAYMMQMPSTMSLSPNPALSPLSGINNLGWQSQGLQSYQNNLNQNRPTAFAPLSPV